MPKADIFQEDSKAGSVLHVILILHLCCSMLDFICLSKKEKQPKNNFKNFLAIAQDQKET